MDIENIKSDIDEVNEMQVLNMKTSFEEGEICTEGVQSEEAPFKNTKPEKKSKKVTESITHVQDESLNPSPDEISSSIKSVEETMSSQFVSITKCVIGLKDPDTKRRHSDIFRERPCKATYPDYYEMIENPIAINDIMRKCRADQYSLVKEFIADWELMFINAKNYNGKKSWITADASILREELQRSIKKIKVVQEPEIPKKKLRIKLSLKKVKQTEEKKESSNSPSVPHKRRISHSDSKGKKRKRKMRS